MKIKLFFKVLISIYLLSFSLSACLPTDSISATYTSPSESPSPTGMIEVMFVKDGNIQVWDEASQQTRTIVNTGDVLAVSMSDDGQMIAYEPRWRQSARTDFSPRFAPADKSQ
jgi:hypothetical protein